MDAKFSVVVLCVLLGGALLQGQEIQWIRQFGTESRDFCWGVAVGSSGIYAVGETGGALPGQMHAGLGDSFVRKYGLDGSVVWTRQFGTDNWDSALGVAVGSEGVYVAGNTAGALPGQANAGDADVFVLKYDPSGSEIWTHQFGSGARDTATAIAVNAEGFAYRRDAGAPRRHGHCQGRAVPAEARPTA